MGPMGHAKVLFVIRFLHNVGSTNSGIACARRHVSLWHRPWLQHGVRVFLSSSVVIATAAIFLVVRILHTVGSSNWGSRARLLCCFRAQAIVGVWRVNLIVLIRDRGKLMWWRVKRHQPT